MELGDLSLGRSPDLRGPRRQAARHDAPRGTTLVRTGWLGLWLLVSTGGCAHGTVSPADAGPVGAPDTAVVTCVPGTTRCVGQAIETCDATGWVSDGERCDPARGESCLLGACVRPCEAAASAHSYVACEYWPTVTPNFVDDPAHYRFAVVVANPNGEPARVSVDRDGVEVASGTVEPGQTLDLVLPWVPELLAPVGDRLGGRNLLLPGGAYHLVSTLPVTVHQYSPFENRFGDRPSFSNDASLLLPTSALGSDYRVVAHSSHMLGDGDRERLNPAGTSLSTGMPGFFAVVATVDATVVTVHAAARTQAGPASDPPMVEGDTRSYTMDRGDVLLVLSKLAFYEEAECVQPAGGGGGCTGGRRTDLTGTAIEASAPIAVFGGHRCVDLPREWLYCDHLEEQMIPVSAWGDHAVAVSSHPIVPEETSLFRVVSASDGNHVVVTSGSAGPFDLDDGDFADFELQDGVDVRGTGRLQLVQYETSGQRVSIVHGSVPFATGDPSMALVAPVAQHRREYTFLTPASFPESFVLVVSPTGSAPPSLDGTVLEIPTPIAGSEHGWLRVPVAPGPHRMTGEAPFGITVQGVSPACSYMMPGGLDLQTLVF